MTFFPSVGMAFGFYSTSTTETRFLALVADVLGFYFCVSCVASVKQSDANGMRQYLMYQIFRFCVMIPVVVVNNLMGNICGTRTEFSRSMGFEDPHDDNYNGTLQASCTAREHIYWGLVLGCFAAHSYFIYLTWLLYARYDSGAMAERLMGKQGPPMQGPQGPQGHFQEPYSFSPAGYPQGPYSQGPLQGDAAAGMSPAAGYGNIMRPPSNRAEQYYSAEPPRGDVDEVNISVQ